MPLSLIIAIPLGEPGSIEIRPAGIPDGMNAPPLPTDSAAIAIGSQEFMNTSADRLARRYAAPAISQLQDKLRKRGF